MAAAEWFAGIPARFPWLFERGLNCVLSPDCDGFLCGLLMSHLLGWNVRGFYNGSVLAVDESVNHRDCVFLDVEIYRPDARSVGQHMLMFDKEKLPGTWGNFAQCVSPNNLREFDHKRDFKRKYPLGTIHLLMAVISARGISVPVPSGAVAPLLYADGTFKNTMKYSNNCVDWLEDMDFENNAALRAVFCGKIPLRILMREESFLTALRSAFCGKTLSPWTLMREMNKFFEDIGGNADKLTLTKSKGGVVSVVGIRDGAVIPAKREKAEAFLKLLADKTEWGYDPDLWTCWENLRVIRLKSNKFDPKYPGFNPKDLEFKDQEKKTGNPISWAITASDRVEMTWDHPDF